MYVLFLLLLLLLLLLQVWQFGWSRLQHCWAEAAAWPGASGTWARGAPAAALHVSSRWQLHCTLSELPATAC
jgi:hypothetical protein